MKFLTDENLGIKVPQFLRSLGFDVKSIKQISARVSDKRILNIANSENRIVITMDNDFAKLISEERLVHSGVILLRLKNESVENKKRVLEKALKSKTKFQNNLRIITDEV